MYLGRSATILIRWFLLPLRYVGIDDSLACQHLSASGNSYLVCGSLGLSLSSLLASQCLVKQWQEDAQAGESRSVQSVHSWLLFAGVGG